MKFKFVLLYLFFSFISLQAQVGIGTTTPKAKLQIKAGTTPSSTDGVLIPSMDNFPTAQNPGADQDGMLIFITGQGTPHKGFYYWSNSDTTWINIIDKKQNLKIPFVTRTELDAITTPENGQLVYDSTDDVTLMWNSSNWIVLSNDCFPQPTTANAGTDINLYVGSTSTTLYANTPVEGQGQWTIISPTGTTAGFSDIHDPHATFTGEACTYYTLKWSISTACSVSSDNVSVNFFEQPSNANAGLNQYFTDGTVSTTLNATAPSQGTGTWSVYSPTNTTTTFSNPNDPHATFIGEACTYYRLRWTVAACSLDTDDVIISYSETPTTASAGFNIYSLSSQTVTLAANTPSQGTGTWSIVNGGTGTFANTHDPNTTFIADDNNAQYILKWTIVTDCSSSDDSMFIFIGNVIGQYAYNGVIFYVDATGSHGLVVSPTEHGFHKWACAYTNITTTNALGSGATNTTNIVTDQSTCSNFAAKTCDDFVLNGYSDWFLPSIDELTELINNRLIINTSLIDNGGTSLNSNLWSSSQVNSSTAYYKNIFSNTNSTTLKTSNYKVRAIRAF